MRLKPSVSGRKRKANSSSADAPGAPPDADGNAAASSPDQADGRCLLPLQRVKRIIKQDKDLAKFSQDATFVIGMATELFLESFLKQSYEHAKNQGRKGIQYKDMASVTAATGRLFFLEDVVPQPVPFARAMEATRNGTAATFDLQEVE